MAFKRRLRLIDSLTLFKHLSMTLKAGLNVSDSLATMDAKKGSAMKKVIDHLKKSVETGHTFSEAVDSAPRTFPPIVLQLIRTGELSGTLRENIEQASRYMTQMTETRRQIRAAMLYPSIVFIAISGLGLSISLFVLPQIIPLFEAMSVELPMPTKILLWIAKQFENHGSFIILGFFAILTTIFIIFRIKILKPITSRILLHIPLIGNLIHLYNLTHICQTLGNLLKSGIPIIEALHATIDATGNPVYCGILKKVTREVEDGNTLSEGLSKHKRIPSLFQRLVSVGERTGSVRDTLAYLAEYYDSELKHSAKNLSTALEPMMLIIVGAMVGFVVFAIITPIYDITGEIG